MKVLVSAASKHGATAEIGDRIAAALRDALPAGTDVDVVAAENVTTVDGYEAVVLGSAVYMGRWLDSARRLAETHAAELSTRPVWLFSSGPTGTGRGFPRLGGHRCVGARHRGRTSVRR